MSVLIVGGGIGGLTAALALARIGHHVEVAERMPRFTPAGAGIVLAPNAVRVLTALGVDLTGCGRPVRDFDIVRADGTLLRRFVPRPLPGGPGALTMTRTALHDALRGTLPPEVRVRTGQTVTSLTEAGDAVEAGCDGESGSASGSGAGSGSYALVIGADGIRSAVRAHLTGDAAAPRYSGDTCWRALTPNPGITRPVEAWGPGSRIGAVPLPEGRLYSYFVLAAPRGAPVPEEPGAFRRAFAHHRGGLTRLFDLLPGPPPLRHDLEEHGRTVWGRGRVVLLGDAAHAMPPSLGQGAAMAIEDAYALALALRPGTAGVPARYAALRHRRVRALRLASRRMGSVAQWRPAAARAVRDAALRAVPRAVADRRYRALVRPALDLLDMPLTAGTTREP
ncbi:FAD-dependent monooxygenase [Streptomyces sp. YIM 98790]|uniref:FAD-dependent monooxygenase n=1 Tax=Streptomyces sp. YIM 98790 TaxID=2689077 RepID=UPI001409AFE2|nr:FAD-dependent monooxygenase [Streptomyces sp. YIM 98790]